MLQTIDREIDVILRNADLLDIHKIDNFPIFMGCVDTPIENDLHADMTWSISTSSGLIQLKKLIPLNILYANSHGSGDIGNIWNEHHNEFARFISKSNPKKILEIGGGNGILSKEFEKFANIDWTIIEPNPTPVKDCPAKFIKGFFDENFLEDVQFDTIVHSHVLEHIYDPLIFMKNLSSLIDLDKDLIFSLPNMKEMLKRNYTNCLNFEHTVFLTEEYIDFLLAKFGFKVLEKKYFMEDHSIFYSTKKDKKPTKIQLPKNLYEINLNLYNNFIEHLEKLIKDLNYKMKQISGPVYLFGAHIFSQYLICSGLNTDKITCILDNDTTKQNKRLYGTSLYVNSPRSLKDKNNPNVILKAGVYNEEIKKDIINNINSNVNFIE
tara:strand:+ start:191 stop:1330 length:1140 start_codon:yes stop_codon:yes gene_type:complete